jgi:hypothetical protein
MKTNYIQLVNAFADFCEANNIDKSKYFLVKSDIRTGKKAAIMKLGYLGKMSLSGGGIYYTYSELLAWMQGYTIAKKLIIFK